MFDPTNASTWTVLVGGDATGGRFAVIDARVRRDAAPPRHVHSREDEFIYVLDGHLSVELDGERFDCPSGSWLHLPCGSDHSLTVESDEARVLVMLSPAGLECSLGELCDVNRPVESAGQHVERLVAIAARYGVTITGPGRPP